jgi:hypothetical protein
VPTTSGERKPPTPGPEEKTREADGEGRRLSNRILAFDCILVRFGIHRPHLGRPMALLERRTHDVEPVLSGELLHVLDVVVARWRSCGIDDR